MLRGGLWMGKGGTMVFDVSFGVVDYGLVI